MQIFSFDSHLKYVNIVTSTLLQATCFSFLFTLRAVAVARARSRSVNTMGFGDLKSAQGVQSLNEFLKDKSYIDGYVPSQNDCVVFEAMSKAPEGKFHHALRWFNHIKSYGDERKKFPGQKKPLDQLGSESKTVAKAEEEDDDIDFFGSDEDDEEAEKLKQARLKTYAEKKAKKPGVIAKSSLLLDCKPWDDETDMAEMEKQVRTIICDGLVWGTGQLVPVGYGIKKLRIACVVEDEKVSVDWLQEQIQNFEDYVQSVDIAAFNKI